MEKLEVAATRIDLEIGQTHQDSCSERYGRFFRTEGEPQYVVYVHGEAPAPLGYLTARVARTKEGRLAIKHAEFLGEFDPSSGRADVRGDPHLCIADKFVGAVVALQVQAAGGCLFHAAAVVVDGKAHLFPGRSGSGKSTLASLAREPLSDEICAVVPSSSGWTVYATPWHTGRAISAPLAGIYTLSWDAEKIDSLPSASALRHLSSQIALFIDETQTRAAAFMAAGAIAASVPFRRLAFTVQTDIDDLLRRQRAVE